MSNNPLNLALRFVLELAALAALGYWAWTQHTGGLRWLLVLALPTAAAAIWGIFRVPGDPSDAPIKISGGVRLAIEACFFGVATLALALSDRSQWAIVFGAVVVLHYSLSFDRIARLIRR